MIFLDIALYVLAAMCILAYPHTKFFTTLDKDTLDKVSTGASVIALGFVFMAIGLNNRRSVWEEKRIRLERMQEILEKAQKTSQREAEENETTMKLLKDMSMTIKELEKEVHELKSNTVKSPV
ncbi:hypothetical protein OF830_26700 [Bacillus paramycoides]|uniref:hypothetical protein n=1 Tax=Bacillus paramycoides TaxID=2026194 RepID=UPI002244D4FC|nr:hypothetical protein [Bacillus paramycoides]MCW9134373.1 hypothetical protein [Bacillus paramycoides]